MLKSKQVHWKYFKEEDVVTLKNPFEVITSLTDRMLQRVDEADETSTNFKKIKTSKIQIPEIDSEL